MARRKRTGRPPKKRAERRDLRETVYFRDAEHDDVVHAAEIEGIPKGIWLRKAAVDAARRALLDRGLEPSSGRPPP